MKKNDRLREKNREDSNLKKKSEMKKEISQLIPQKYEVF